MESDSIASTLDRAMAAVRAATDSHGRQEARSLLTQLTGDGATALRIGRGLLDSDDADRHEIGSDLLGMTSELHSSVREAAASVLPAHLAGETDTDVLWSIVRSLGATEDPRAVAALVVLADHEDSDIRQQVAQALPAVSMEEPQSVLSTLIRLTRDADADVRNWATFGLGFQVEADSESVRSALWARTEDAVEEVREEAIRGLARRHDPRSVPLLAALLDSEGDIDSHTFRAAEILRSPDLLPHLLRHGSDAARALSACDPVAQRRQDAFATSLLESLHLRLPESDVATYTHRFEGGTTLAAAGLTWDMTGLYRRSAGDPTRASDQVIADCESRA